MRQAKGIRRKTDHYYRILQEQRSVIPHSGFADWEDVLTAHHDPTATTQTAASRAWDAPLSERFPHFDGLIEVTKSIGAHDYIKPEHFDLADVLHELDMDTHIEAETDDER